GLIYYGSTAEVMPEVAHLLKAHGLEVDLLKVKALPAQKEVFDFISHHKTVFLIEQNRDAQMKQALCLEKPNCAGRIKSILSFDGLPLIAENLVTMILQQEKLQ
ncbi:MAG: hypothetical protein KDD22_01800, partial [Bdellovibrionales bacterium]|nr:hypothetical protein [Bdellovibrionales bacterium]